MRRRFDVDGPGRRDHHAGTLIGADRRGDVTVRLVRLSCHVIGHAVPACAIWNDGRFFGRCGRCGTDLLRRPQGRWGTVPDGYRVVWRAPARVRHRPALVVVWDGTGRGGVAANCCTARAENAQLAEPGV